MEVQKPKFNLRHNRLLKSNDLLSHVPLGVGYNERNVVFGLGTATAGAPGAFQLSQSAPRDIILRDLVIAMGSARGRVTAITAEGEALVLASSLAVETFSPLNPNRPPFDLPVAGGTVVSVNVTADAAYTCDGGFIID